MDAEIQRLLQGIDLNRPGAVEALEKAQAEGAAVEVFRDLVARFPLQFAGGFVGVTEVQHHAALALLRSKIKSPDKATVAVRSGCDVRSGSPARISWGNANLDWISDGGIPRARGTEVKGAPGTGKTYAALEACAQVLALRGKVLWVAFEPFDSDWARVCGVPVWYPPEVAVEGSVYAQFNADHLEGEGFDLLVGRTGNEVLQLVCNAIQINTWDLIVVDSLGPAVAQVHLENKVVGDSSPGGEAFMINQFAARAQTEWNGVASYEGRAVAKRYACKSCGAIFKQKGEHEACPVLEQQAADAAAEAEKGGKKARAKKVPAPKFEESLTYGEPPRTALLVVNQLRAQGIGSNSPKPPPDDSAGGKGFHHAKSLSIMFFGRTLLKTEVGGYGEVYGSIVQVRADKSKVGTPDRTGVVELWTKTIPGVSEAGRYNLMTDLVGARLTFGDTEKVFEGLAQRAGIIRQAAAWYYLGDEKFNGQGALHRYLAENRQVLQAVRAALGEWVRGSK